MHKSCLTGLISFVCCTDAPGPDAPCFQGFEAYVGVLLLQTALHGLASEWQARMILTVSLFTVECQIGLNCLGP